MPQRIGLKERRGVTLVEAVIAMAIVFIIVSGTAYIIYSTIVTEMNSERLAVANNFARERIELLKGRGYDNISVGETTVNLEPDGSVASGGLYTVVTRVTQPTNPATGETLRMKEIVVEVYVNRPNHYLAVTQQTAIHQRGV